MNLVLTCGSGLGVQRGEPLLREHLEPDWRLLDRPLPPRPVDVVALGPVHRRLPLGLQ